MSHHQSQRSPTSIVVGDETHIGLADDRASFVILDDSLLGSQPIDDRPLLATLDNVPPRTQSIDERPVIATLDDVLPGAQSINVGDETHMDFAGDRTLAAMHDFETMEAVSRKNASAARVASDTQDEVILRETHEAQSVPVPTLPSLRLDDSPWADRVLCSRAQDPEEELIPIDLAPLASDTPNATSSVVIEALVRRLVDQRLAETLPSSERQDPSQKELQQKLQALEQSMKEMRVAHRDEVQQGLEALEQRMTATQVAHREEFHQSLKALARRMTETRLAQHEEIRKVTESNMKLREEVISVRSELDSNRHTQQATQEALAESIRKPSESKLELQDEVDSLRLALNDLSQTIHTVHAEGLTSIRLEVDSVQRTQRSQDQTVQRLAELKPELRDGVKSLRVAIHDLQCSHEKTKAKGSEDVKKLTKSHAELQDKFQSFRHKTESRNYHQSTDIESSAHAVAILQKECESIRRKVELFTTSCANLPRDVAQLTKSNANLKRRVDKTETKVENMRLDVKVLQKQEQLRDAQLAVKANRIGMESTAVVTRLPPPSVSETAYLSGRGPTTRGSRKE